MANRDQHQSHGQNQTQVALVMVPFPAQGHLNQLLQLSLILSSHSHINIPIHFVGTTTHNRQAKLRIHGWNPKSIENIHFHEFPTPFFLSPLPDPNASIQFPSHLQPSFDASQHLREPVALLVRRLSAACRRVVIIHDSLMGSVVHDTVISLPNVESYTFHSVSAFAVFFFLWENLGKPFPVESEILEDLPSLEGCFTSEFLRFAKTRHAYIRYSSGRIFNTCREIEGPFLDLLCKEEINENKRQFALGPFNPVTIRKSNKSNQNQGHICLGWLDKQGPNSVLFVSFGTTSSFTDEQIKEIAIGLEESKQKFIWVLRDADRGDVFVGESRKAELPKGFEERVGEKGMVVRDWVPQLEILGHPSVGGFLSHCGWNSSMESISMGVPMAAWPIHSDQPRNTVLITKWFKVGLVVRDWARRNKLVTSSVVAEAVRRLMASDEGDEMRKRAKELRASVRRAVAEGGVTRSELDSFIVHITR